MGKMYTPNDVSVIICTYSQDRWDDLVEAVESIHQQSAHCRELIVVIDHNNQLFIQVREQLPGVIAIENQGSQGAGEARNTGAFAATGSILAFMDDDAIALPDWLEQLCAGYTDSRVIGVGGFLEPLWTRSRPGWFPREFDWVVGGSYEGMPTVTATIRNIWTGNLSVRSEVFKVINGFRIGFGKVGRHSNPEDTEFCIRALQQFPDGCWRYIPEAKVLHRVPQSRATFSFFLRRCYYEGTGKASLVSLVGSQMGTNIEWKYTLQTLPKGVLHGFSDTLFRADLGGILRSGVIIIGLSFTTVGYIAGTVESRIKKTPVPSTNI
jgi:GT2 family glycosyltransferase